MKPKNHLSIITFMLLLALLLAACGRAEEAPEPTATATVTAVPPTNTPAPTNTPEPTNTPPPTATAVPDLTLDFVPFEDEFQGITLAHPPGWVVENFFFTILASSETLSEQMMAGDTPDSIDGAVIILVGGGTDEFDNDDPSALIDEAIAEFDVTDGEVEILSGPTVSSSGDQESVLLIAQGESEGIEVVVLYAVIVNRVVERTAILIGVTSPAVAEEYMPLMEAVVSTVEIGESDMMDEFGDLFGTESTAGLENATAIFLYETLPAEVTSDGPAVFSFSGAPTVRYDIVVDTEDDNLDLVLDLLDETGASLLDSEVDETFSGTEAIRGFQPEDFGLFYVTVRGFAGGTGSFEISLLESTTPESQLDEPGSELTATASMSQDGRVLFHFTAEMGELITAVVSPLDNLDVVLGIYDEADTLLFEVDEAFGEESLTFIAPDAGLYYLAVSSFAGAGGSFNMSLFATPGVVLELFNGDVLNGWLDDSGMTDYVIDLRAGETLTVNAQPETGFDVVLELLDADERALLEADDGFQGGAETLTFTAEADGFYFIHVRGFAWASGMFTLTIDVE